MNQHTELPADFTPTEPASITPEVKPPETTVLTGISLQVADSAMVTVMEAVEAAEARVKRLREQAEFCTKHLSAWSNEFASQYTQLMEQCTTLESTIGQAVEAIKAIGKPVENDENSLSRK